MDILNMPQELRSLVAKSNCRQEISGCSGADVWRLEKIAGAFWLKSDVAGGELEQEANVLKWVQNRVPAPKILWHGVENGREWLLTSEVPGRNLTKIEDRNLVVTLLAQGMRMLHSLDTSNCPFSMALDFKLAEAGRRVEAGLVDEADFEPAFQGLSAQEVWERVLALRPTAEDLVFTHGDYCLPNIFTHQGQVSGFVDWGRAGLADRYQDLALAVRSLDFNFGPGPWSKLLFQAYGLENPDWQRVQFYILLDELF